MRKGFTLLELVIVVIIVAVLAGLGIPQFIRTVERAKAAEGVSTLGTLRSSQLRYYAEYNVYTTTCGQLDTDAPASTTKFAAPVCAASGNIVRVTRQASSYTLGITADGTLGCQAGANACPAGF